MNSTERENYEYLKARVVNLESDLRAALSELKTARAELEAARGQADELEKMNRHLSSFLEEAAHAAASGENPKKYLATSAPTVLRDRIKELWEALTALRRQIDGALLKDVENALVDWIATYASDMCNPNDVKKSVKRIRENGGTLAYVSELLDRVSNAIKSTPATAPEEVKS